MANRTTQDAMFRRQAATKIRQSRDRHELLHLQAYCQAIACAARDVTVYLKDYDRTLVEAVEARGLTCPVCGGVLALHGVRTPLEHDAEFRQAARMSVNTQMYERDHAHADGLPACIPVEQMIRDDIPPSPEGWWDARPPKGQPS